MCQCPILCQPPGGKKHSVKMEKDLVDTVAVVMLAPNVQEGNPVAFSLKTLTPSEKMYANIEGELLVIAWGAQKFHTYVYGRRVFVETDHKPLDSIFRKPLNEAPPRLQRMLLKLTKYDLVVRYVPGKKQVISACLSRAPHSETKLFSEPEDVRGVNLVDELGLERSILKRFKDSSSADETSQSGYGVRFKRMTL